MQIESFDREIYLENCAKGAATTNAKRVKCIECGLISTPAGLASHLRKTDHDSYLRNHTLSSAGRLGGKKSSALINARRVKCLDCGLISTPGAIANHLKYSGHERSEEVNTG